MVRKILTIFCFLLTYSFGYAQILPGIQSVSSFEEKNTKRIELAREISMLEAKVSQFFEKDTLLIINDIDYFTTEISLTEEKIEKAKGKNDTSNLEYLNEVLSKLKEDHYRTRKSLEESRVVSKNKADLQLQIQRKKDDLNEIERDINILLTPKIAQQNFMFYSSIFFVLLMSILLGIFYYVIRRDDQARKVIFGGETGIQFIALFSIIIAIILFGLTGVLEGKELAALLGSVAGYILGRTKFSGDTPKSPQPNAPLPNPPLPNPPQPNPPQLNQ